MQPPSEQITELLQSWSQEDQSAIEKLVPLVYDELYRLAKRYMSDERPGSMDFRESGKLPWLLAPRLLS